MKKQFHKTDFNNCGGSIKEENALPECLAKSTKIKDSETYGIALETVRNNGKGAKRCYDSDDKILDALIAEAANDPDFEHKKYYFEKMARTSMEQKKFQKEDKKTNNSIIILGFLVGGFSLLAGLRWRFALSRHN